MSARDTIFHKWLKIPYLLHVRKVLKVKNAKQTVVFIHGLGSTGEMWQPVIDGLAKDVSLLSVDLLGFGSSPRPAWETYNVALQARSLSATLRRQKLSGPIIIVGHSLGALVAIEFAKTYPQMTKSLVLCSPPVYRPDDDLPRVSPERLLRRMYRRLLRSPQVIIRLYNLGKRTRIDPSLMVNSDNIGVFASAAEASILNQTAINDIAGLKLPITILHGILDPVVVQSNLIALAKKMPNVTFIRVNASHALNRAYVAKINGILESDI